ncbi:MAG: hypothetical protein M3348_18715 [Acidobacteriota bacterium]|nr:hypothetical protein [Acidobacteriota bacterium]
MAYYYAKLGGLYAKYATLGGARGDLRRERWREARSWYQKSLDLWHQVGSGGTLSRADADKADEVVREIAKCDTALGE